MVNVTVLIEKGQDGTYGAYIPDNNPLEFGVIGDGNSVEQAKADFLNVYEQMREYYIEQGSAPLDASFSFKYDIPSFLNYYTTTFTLVGLSRITGIAKGQLSHYVNGTSRPNDKTISKIEKSMQEYGRELSKITLI